MEEWEIAAALRGTRPHPLHHAIPPSLRPWLVDVEWDPARLWTIRRPVASLPVAAMRWCFELPWWRAPDGGGFAVTPCDVIDHPRTFPEHDLRIAYADLDEPVHVMHRHARWVVVDGIHRVVKAELDDAERVAVVPLGPAQLTRIAVRRDMRQFASRAASS